MNIGILGGTFNPPHIGHLILAQEAIEQLKLDKLFFVPTNKPPHKGKNQLDSGHRLKMIQLASEDNPYFEVSDIEIKRKGVSYTVDSLVQFKNNYPKSSLYLIIGSDLANDFDKWRNPDKIKEISKVIVAQREGIPLRKEDEFKKIEITQIGISSSSIRKRIKECQSIRYLVAEKVKNYIKENDLYL